MNVTMATIKMVYKFVQSDAHIIPIVKNNYKYYLCFNYGCHGKNCGRLYVNPKVYGHRYITLYSPIIS